MATSLSAGIIIRELLLGSQEVTRITSKVFPVCVDKVKLPYVYYARTGFSGTPVKGPRGADTVEVAVSCCAEGYDESLALAEAVRDALDGAQAVSSGMCMRSCLLTGAAEGYQGDAYVQELIFTIKI